MVLDAGRPKEARFRFDSGLTDHQIDSRPMVGHVSFSGMSAALVTESGWVHLNG